MATQLEKSTIVRALSTVSYNGKTFLAGQEFAMEDRYLAHALRKAVVKVVSEEAPPLVAPTPPAFKPKNIVIEKSDKSILMSLNVLEEEQADALIVAGLNSIQKIKDSTNTDLEAVKTIGRATVAKLKDAVKDLKVGEA